MTGTAGGEGEGAGRVTRTGRVTGTAGGEGEGAGRVTGTAGGEGEGAGRVTGTAGGEGEGAGRVTGTADGEELKLARREMEVMRKQLQEVRTKSSCAVQTFIKSFDCLKHQYVLAVKMASVADPALNHHSITY